MSATGLGIRLGTLRRRQRPEIGASGGSRRVLSLEDRSAGDGTYTIGVSDRGRGGDRREGEIIFEAFSRGRNAPSGTGVGLEVASYATGGTRFEIALPATPAAV